MERTVAVIASQRLMLALIDVKGKKISRQTAYKVVQSLAQKAWTEHADFKTLVLEDQRVQSFLDKNKILQCFDPNYFVRHTNAIFKRVNL